MTNREKFNQYLQNYVNTIINMEDKDLIKNSIHSMNDTYLKLVDTGVY